MPTLEISKKDLEKLAGVKITDETLMLAKAEIESKQADTLKLEIADTNRPDLWSTEGIAREIKGKFTEIKTSKSGLKVIVDKNLKDIRPKTVCAVIKNIKLNQQSLNQLIQLQEKICETFGRKRKEVAIGVYDYDKIKSPIRYKAFAPEEIEFMPLRTESDQRPVAGSPATMPLETKNLLTLSQILKQHPKGKEYAHLLQGKSRYPIFMDENQEILSMPPIINSDYTGKVTTKTKNLFIECSGFDFRFLEPALNTLVYALAQRGGKIQTVEIIYQEKTIITPNLKPKTTTLNVTYFNKRSGLGLTRTQIVSLLNKSSYKLKSSLKNNLILHYPAYRQDIMHQADVVEDLIIRCGYNKIKPVTPELATTGKLLPIQEFQHKTAEFLIGLGVQEVINYTLTNKENLFKKMNITPQETIEIENPVSKNWSVFRNWITPCLMEFLSKNIKKEYPQKIFEVGQVIIPDKKAETRSKNPTHLAYAHTSKTTDFTKVKQAFDFLMDNLGLTYKIEETTHDSFISGRVGRVIINNKPVAYIGEIHPKVLQNWGIRMPVTIFELNLSDLLGLM
ncbi:MAG: phenylalanine--tRNA ligase subunit beta [Nanoarchaeota archaeon]|nr:phenylalanine--tRNA ligase subunit beta [Nanoarchaeota archaeon]